MSFFFSRFQSEKRGLSIVKKLKAFSLCHGGVVVKAVVLSNPLNNHKVSWLKSEREGLGKIEKSRWCSGGAVVLEA